MVDSVDLKDLNMEGLLDLFCSQIEALWALLVFVNLLLHSHKDFLLLWAVLFFVILTLPSHLIDRICLIGALLQWAVFSLF